MEVVAEAGSCAEVLDALRTHDVDIAIVDLTMPGCTGAEIVTHVKSVRQDVRVIVLTMHDQEPYITQALRAGAEGFATKDLGFAAFCDAVWKVHGGGRYLCPVAVENLAFSISQQSDDEFPHKLLTARELQILEFLIHGLGGREIASRLSLSEKTVSTHKVNMFRKMNVSTRTDLIHYAARNHLFNI